MRPLQWSLQSHHNSHRALPLNIVPLRYPKDKRRTAVRLADIPADDFLDPAVWYHFFKINVFAEDEHGPEMMYEVILAHLASTVPLEASWSAKELRSWLASEAKAELTLFPEAFAALAAAQQKVSARNITDLTKDELAQLLQESVGLQYITQKIGAPAVGMRTQPSEDSRNPGDHVDALDVLEVCGTEKPEESEVLLVPEYLKLAEGRGYALSCHRAILRHSVLMCRVTLHHTNLPCRIALHSTGTA